MQVPQNPHQILPAHYQPSTQRLLFFLQDLEDKFRYSLIFCLYQSLLGSQEYLGILFPLIPIPVGIICYFIGENFPNHNCKWNNHIYFLSFFIFIHRTHHHLSRCMLHLFISLLGASVHYGVNHHLFCCTTAPRTGCGKL